jgi:adenylosuccinate lyase
VLDTALALQIRDAGALVLEGVDRAFAAVAATAEQHRRTVTIGRTHGVHAEPTTFGAKLAGWAFELARDRERLEAALERVRVGKLAGAWERTAAATPTWSESRATCSASSLSPSRRRWSRGIGTRSSSPRSR